jgi:hypothetical protein
VEDRHIRTKWAAAVARDLSRLIVDLPLDFRARVSATDVDKKI